MLCHYLYQFFTIWFKRERKALVLMKRWTDYFAWNGTIQAYNEVYLCLCISVFFNTYTGINLEQFSTYGLALNSVLTIIFGLSLVMVPIAIVFILKKTWCKCIDEIVYVKNRHNDRYNWLKNVSTYADVE